MRTKEDYVQAVANSNSITEMCKYFGILPRGANFSTMKHKIAFYNLDTSHFTKPVNLSKYHGLPVISKRSLKTSLIDERGYKCECCGKAKWLGLPITLEIEHIDADNTNNDFSNLLLLCPNCHAETPTWKSGQRSRGFHD